MRMASVSAAVANGGLWIEPVLILEPKEEPPARSRVLTEQTAALLREWMLDVVRHGTGRRAAAPGLLVGGKTGTAQNESGDKLSHSWFIGFAYPEGSGPEQAVAFSFIVENGGYGGRAAAQAASDFLKTISGSREAP
jgi:peptidoglycan glycosyltransferase